MPQPLSSKESNLFRTIVKSYEEKQYKKGLKAAEQILRKNAKHADTIAMKALIFNAQGKPDEAFALCKEALTFDMKSHICWHVYGIIYRTNKNFEEAMKAYKFALKLDPDNAQIQRDLATIQIQLRDYDGYLQSRLKILQARPQTRQNWTAVAVAHHLAGQHESAENILTTYEGTIKSAPSKGDFENSEAVMYKNMIIAEQGDYQRALEHLEDSAKRNLDRLAYLEARAQYLAKLGRKDDAEQAYRALLDRNSELKEYYDALVEVLGIGQDEAAQKAIYDEYAEKNPRCDAAKRLPLDFLSGDEFRKAARGYLTFMLNKGVPSTFANLKHLYSDPFKRETLPSLVEEYRKQQGGANGTATNSGGSGAETSALYFLAQHYDYYMSRDLAKADEYIDKAIELDPKNVDFHMTKARIWKHRGDVPKASETMDHARSLDTRDRYINTKAAKYQLRNNENDKALKTMGMFTRSETPGGPLADLLDMQSIWYLTEDGEAYARQNNFGLALKRFHQVANIFDVWQEDQWDFHSFSLRKGLVRAYVDMIRWEDRLREHTFFSRAALDAARLYVTMHDKNRSAANGVNGSGGEETAEEAAERKKVAKKARKEAQKAEREAAEKAAKQDPNKPKSAEEAKKKDDDPLGTKLAATADPLGEATKLLNHLLLFSPKNADAQLAGFDVYLRRKKYVRAMGCLEAAVGLGVKDADDRAGQLRQALKADGEGLPPQVQELLKSYVGR